MKGAEFSLAAGNPDLASLIGQMKNFMTEAKARNTRRAYASDWRDFESWCRGFGLPVLPSAPEVVAFYIADCASRLEVSTIHRRLASITSAHHVAGFEDSPAGCQHFVVAETLKGIRRQRGIRQKGKEPLLAEDIRAMVASSREGMLGCRDRALILVGFAGAFRRSELARIEVCDLRFFPNGALIQLPNSKTDQEGAGRTVVLARQADSSICPVEAIVAWLERTGIREGAVFRLVDRHGRIGQRGLNPDSIARILKRAARRTGIDAANIAGHSLRAGYVTQATIEGLSETLTMQQTGHRSIETLERYVRLGKLHHGTLGVKGTAMTNLNVFTTR